MEQDGIDFKKFREEIRNEIISVRLREREVDSKLVISENDVDNYLAIRNSQEGKGEELQLAHILVVVPEQASADKIQTYRTRAELALIQIARRCVVRTSGGRLSPMPRTRSRVANSAGVLQTDCRPCSLIPCKK